MTHSLGLAPSPRSGAQGRYRARLVHGAHLLVLLAASAPLLAEISPLTPLQAVVPIIHQRRLAGADYAGISTVGLREGQGQQSHR